MADWDIRFLELAKHIASWSKDPSTQVGAVIVDKKKRVVSVGYNGFAQGVKDSPERYENRDIKYKIVVHAERNAIIFAKQNLEDCTIYTWPFQPCSVCAGMIIQSGIKRIVAPKIEKTERWYDDMALACETLEEAEVKLDLIDFV